MKAMVVSATPKQLDSVGAWQTMMPSSVAASVSTSSTPTVYLATMRRRCEACMIRRLIGVWRMDVPMSATASRAASTTAASCVVRGNCQSRSPKTSSQPKPSSALTASGGSSRGAKIKIFGFDMEAPWVDAGEPGRLFRGEEIAAGRSVELYSTILEHAIPTVQLFAHEGVEFLRRAAGHADARFFQLLGDDGIGIHLDHFALNLVDDRARRAGRRHQPDPGRNVVERRNAGFDRERPDFRQSRQRAAVELGERPQLAALDEREAGGGAIDHVVNRAGQETLHRGRAAVERNVLQVETSLAIEQIAGKARRDDAGAVIELAGTGFGARDQFFHGLGPILGADVQQRRVLGRERDRGEVLERIIRQVAGGYGIEHHGDIHHGEQGVAVGCHLGDARGRDRGIGAGLVFDHHRLVPHLAQALAGDAHEDIGRSARRERHDDADGSIGIALAVGGPLGSRVGDREHADEACEAAPRADRAAASTQAEDEAHDVLRLRRALQSYFIPVSFTTTDQRCASLRMKAENSAGVLVAGNRPEASAFAFVAGSARIFATSVCSLSTMAGCVPLGATSPSQTVISSIFGSSAVMIGRSGTGGNGRGSNLANTRNAPLWISESDADGPSKEKSTLLVSTPWATSALPL